MATIRHQAPEPDPDLIQRIRDREVIPLIGAGFSKSAQPKEGSVLLEFLGMPTYPELLERLLNKALNIEKDDRGIILNYLRRKGAKASEHYDEAAAVLRKSMGNETFFLAIRDILEPIDEDIVGSLAHKFLGMLNFRRIVTTNYDRLLEGFATPRHEVITPDDEMCRRLFIHDSRRSYILKLHGDITRPNKIPWGRSELLRNYGYDSYNEPLQNLELAARNRIEILKTIFEHNTILFLGTSLSESEGFSQVLRNLVQDWRGKLPRRHYALVPVNRELEAYRKDFADRMNVKLEYYKPDKTHSQVWEFLSLLKTGKPEPEPQPGHQWEQWYLQKERSEYLLAQLEREKSATSVRYLTPTLTNAVATREYLDSDCRDDLKGRYRPKVVGAVLRAMQERASNLDKRLRNEGLEVRVLFLERELCKSLDVSQKDREKLARAVARYKYLLDLTEATDIEIRVIPDLTRDDLKRQEASFALIFNRFEGGSMADVTIAYSSQATNDFPEIHMVHTNTSEIWRHVFTFERFWAAAKNEEETKLLIRNLLSRV